MGLGFRVNLGAMLRTRALWSCLPVLFAVGTATAQELEPRAYRTLPTGYNFLRLNYSYATGNVLFDPTAAIEGLDAEIHTTGVSYARSLGIAGRSASFSLLVPFVFLSASGTLNGQFLSGSRSEFADSQYRLAVNLLGGPALTPEAFAQYQQGRNLGVGLTVIAPTGDYDSSRLVNFGANRWGFKPEVGYSSIRGRWIFDGALGVWLFTGNDDFMGASRRREPITNIQGHVSYTFNGGTWLAFDANWYSGGRTKVNGVENADLQSNSRVGLTLSIPTVRGQAFKLTVQTGAFTRIGADFDIASVAYQFSWRGDGS